MVGAAVMALASSIALIHGIYYTFNDDHPVEFPFMNRLTIGIALYSFLATAMAFRGRRYLVAVSGPLLLALVAIWDLNMVYLCLCTHSRLVGYLLIPLISVSLLLIVRSRNEFLK